MVEGKKAPFHVGLTPERVVDEAVALTRESHLMAWSIRDLAARLGVAQSVIYHHVGGKDLLCRGVVERALGQIVLPGEDVQPWQAWFRALLYGLGPLAHEYPGVAKWLVMHGPTVPGVFPTMEAGMAVLHRAGFGERAPLAYALLLNTAMLTVTMSDDRALHEEDGPRDHATMMAEFRDLSQASVGVQSMGDSFLRPFADGGEAAEAMKWTYYRFAVDTVISGLSDSIASGS